MLYHIYKKSNRLSYFLLFFILFIGFILRVSGIISGIWSINKYNKINHPDEFRIAYYVREFPNSFLWNTDFRIPTFLHHIISFATLPFYRLKSGDIYDFLLRFDIIMITGRLFSISAGIGAIILTYLVVKRNYDRNMAFLAAVLLTFSMYHVVNSSYLTTDITTSFFLILYIYWIIRAFQTKTTKYFVFAGVTLGLLIGTKYTGALALIFIPVFIYFYDIRLNPEMPLGKRLKNIVFNWNYWIVLILAVIMFFLTTPGLFLHPQEFIDSIKYQSYWGVSVNQLPRWDISIWVSQADKLINTIGLPLALAFIVGLIYSISRRNPVEWAGLILILVFCLYFGNSLAARYIILITPLIAIYASLALITPIRNSNQRIRWFGIILSVVVISYSVVYSVLGAISRYPETRTQAAEFIDKNIPLGSTIGLGYTTPEYEHPNRYPWINFREKFIYMDFLERPQYIVMSSTDF